MATSQSPSNSELLDQRVIDECDDDVPVDPSEAESWTLSQLCWLLLTIVQYSDGKLDKKYSSIKAIKRALITRKGLWDSLIAAWNKKSFADIRDLGFLQTEPQSEEHDTGTWISIVDQNLRRRLAVSFRDTYYGLAVDGFYEYLTENESSFRNQVGMSYYGRFCSIVQSSGTGKSRIFTELHKKDVIVIYMNLRPIMDIHSFPARDDVPSQILTPRWCPNEATYEIVCGAFFAALFDTLAEHLSHTKERADIMRWVSQMCNLAQFPKHPVRDAFFAKLEKNYQMIRGGLSRNRRVHVKDTSGASSHSKTVAVTSSGMDIGQAIEQFERILYSDSTSTFNLASYVSSALNSALQKVSECLDRIFPDQADKNKPKLVIEFDEAHTLTEGGYNYRPADILCKVVSAYSHAGEGKDTPVWVVFTSTTPEVADFSLPNDKYKSDRVPVHGRKLFVPYTQLGWDQNAWRVDDTPISDISRFDYIMGFGRPLWLSLRYPLSSSCEVFNTASYKLLGANSRFDTQNKNEVLAVLGQRFSLEVSFGRPNSIAYLDKGVASHLRICLAITANRSWMFTCYPSEPLLSCTAAKVLHECPEHLERSLKILFEVAKSGMINIGQRGELASRLLWLLAKDLYVRTKIKGRENEIPWEWESHMRDCVMIPVVDWLEFVFGPQVWQTEGARTAFENACVNFSHWISMGAIIGGSEEETGLNLYEFTQRHWYRTSAVQCCHLQPLIDKMIPIYFKSDLEGTGTAKHQFSHILISDKADQSHTSESDLSSVTRAYESIGGGSDLGDSLPYITILADLAQPPGLTVTFPQGAVGDRALQIHAKGINVETYPFLAGHPGVENALRDLVQFQQSTDMERPVRKYLEAQAKFGATTTPRHTLWERGKEAPDVSECA